jgi:hypothetical protein
MWWGLQVGASLGLKVGASVGLSLNSDMKCGLYEEGMLDMKEGMLDMKEVEKSDVKCIDYK